MEEILGRPARGGKMQVLDTGAVKDKKSALTAGQTRSLITAISDTNQKTNIYNKL